MSQVPDVTFQVGHAALLGLQTQERGTCLSSGRSKPSSSKTASRDGLQDANQIQVWGWLCMRPWTWWSLAAGVVPCPAIGGAQHLVQSRRWHTAKRLSMAKAAFSPAVNSRTEAMSCRPW